MPEEFLRRVARIDRGDLSTMPAEWTNAERGRHLRRLLQGGGIQPHRLFQVEYHPTHRCWLITQVVAAEPAGVREPLPGAREDELFYGQLLAELKRVARAACAALAARSMHFARFGCKYELPAQPQELTPADLFDLLGGRSEGDSSVRFDSEGRWRQEPQGH